MYGWMVLWHLKPTDSRYITPEIVYSLLVRSTVFTQILFVKDEYYRMDLCD